MQSTIEVYRSTTGPKPIPNSARILHSVAAFNEDDAGADLEITVECAHQGRKVWYESTFDITSKSWFGDHLSITIRLSLN